MSSFTTPPLRDRVRGFTSTPHFAKLWRYGAVSVATTILTLVLIYVFYRKVKVGRLDIDGWVISPAETANILATCISAIPSYYLNRAWAWKKSGKSHVWREVVPFWVIAAASLALSTYVVGVASREAHLLSSRREVQTILVELGNLSTYAVMWIAKYAIFNKLLFAGGDREATAPVADGTRSEPSALDPDSVAPAWREPAPLAASDPASPAHADELLGS